MRLQRHAAQRVQTMRPETGAKSFHLLPLIAFCTAAKAALLQAQAQSLHLCYALCPKPKKLLACDPAFLQVQGLHATRLHTKRIIARLKRACMAGRGSHAWRPSSKLEPSNFCAKQARVSDAKGWTQGRRDGAAGSRCEIPGEADLQEDARLAASLVQMHTGSCG